MKKLTFLTAILLATTTFAQIPNYVPTNGLVGWWPFNGNANDESGNGNNGTVNGATLTSDRNGVANQAYSFDGINDFISMNNAPFINGPFTISGWIKYNTQSFNPIIGLGELGGSSFKRLYLVPDYSSGKPGIGTAGYNDITSISNVTTVNAWNHVVVVFNNYNLNSVYFYVGGNLLSSNTTNGSSIPFPLNNTGFTIGRHTGSGTNYAEAKIDDIGIWNRALTACEIKDLYHSQLGYTTINAGLDQFSCVGEDVTLQGVGGNALTWNNGVINNTPFVPTQTSSYILTGTDSIGCIGSDTVTVFVSESSSSSQTQTALDTYTWPVNNQTYTQSGTYSDTLVNAAGCDSIVTLNLTLSYTGINELNASQLVVSPNPTKDNFSISGLELLGTITSLEIKDAAGKVVKVLDPTTTNFSCVGLKAGVYFLNITSNKLERVIKIIKE